MRKILELANKENELIGVRTYSLELDEVIIGFVSQIEEDFFVLKEIDENVSFVGKTTIYLEDVITLFYKDRYQKRLKFLLDRKDDITIGEQTLIYAVGNQLLNNLKEILEKKNLTTFYFKDEHFATGILIELNKEHILIKNIGLEGDEDGVSCYLIDDLCGLRYNGFDEQKLSLLYNNEIK